MLTRRSGLLLALLSILGIGCEQRIGNGSSGALQSHLDKYCAERGKEALNSSEKYTRVEAFYSPKINTCVQIEVGGSDKGWSFDLRDVTNGFFRGPKLTKLDLPLTIYAHDDRYFKSAYAEGFWEAADSGTGKQLVAPIAAKITCHVDDKVCRESDASVFLGIIQPDSHEYAIWSWTRHGIIADDSDEGSCAIGHRLSIDFTSNSVFVTDYPKKASEETCKPFQTANSYALHGGTIGYTSMNDIFSCGSSGVNNAVTDKVIALHGAVADKPYSEWMDNGEGGPPATEKTPPKPYTQGDCERLMENKLSELRRD